MGGGGGGGEGCELPPDTPWGKGGGPEALPSPPILVYLFIKLEV